MYIHLVKISTKGTKRRGERLGRRFLAEIWGIATENRWEAK